MNFVYLLTANDCPFYVGVTNDIKVRYRTHKNQYGDHIVIQILEECEDEQREVCENKWITKYIEDGFVLRNSGTPQQSKLRTYKIADEFYFKAMRRAKEDGITLCNLIQGFVEAYGNYSVNSEDIHSYVSQLPAKKKKLK